MKNKRAVWLKVAVYVSLIVIGFFFVAPTYWVVSSSLKADRELMIQPPVWFPTKIMWSNYVEAVQYLPMLLYLKNTAYYCFLSMIGTVLSCTLIAYGLSRIEWPGREVLFILILSTMMIPYHAIMIPLFFLFKSLGWINSYKPLIVPAFFGTPFYIFLLRQFFRTIPTELSDASRIDGASEFTTFLRVIIPLAIPAITVLLLFQFLYRWNDFVGPLIYLTREELFPIALGLNRFLAWHESKWSYLLAVSSLMTLPIVVLFFFAQKTFIEQIHISGMKG